MNKNVVIFFTDQQRFDSLGCNGNVDAITKNIMWNDDLSGREKKKLVKKILTVLQWRDVILPDIWLPTQSVCLREQVL